MAEMGAGTLALKVQMNLSEVLDSLKKLTSEIGKLRGATKDPIMVKIDIADLSGLRAMIQEKIGNLPLNLGVNVAKEMKTAGTAIDKEIKETAKTTQTTLETSISKGFSDGVSKGQKSMDQYLQELGGLYGGKYPKTGVETQAGYPYETKLPQEVKDIQKRRKRRELVGKGVELELQTSTFQSDMERAKPLRQEGRLGEFPVLKRPDYQARLHPRKLIGEDKLVPWGPTDEQGQPLGDIKIPADIRPVKVPKKASLSSRFKAAGIQPIAPPWEPKPSMEVLPPNAIALNKLSKDIKATIGNLESTLARIPPSAKAAVSALTPLIDIGKIQAKATGPMLGTTPGLGQFPTGMQLGTPELRRQEGLQQYLEKLSREAPSTPGGQKLFEKMSPFDEKVEKEKRRKRGPQRVKEDRLSRQLGKVGEEDVVSGVQTTQEAQKAAGEKVKPLSKKKIKEMMGKVEVLKTIQQKREELKGRDDLTLQKKSELYKEYDQKIEDLKKQIHPLVQAQENELKAKQITQGKAVRDRVVAARQKYTPSSWMQKRINEMAARANLPQPKESEKPILLQEGGVQTPQTQPVKVPTPEELGMGPKPVPPVSPVTPEMEALAKKNKMPLKPDREFKQKQKKYEEDLKAWEAERAKREEEYFKKITPQTPAQMPATTTAAIATTPAGAPEPSGEKPILLPTTPTPTPPPTKEQKPVPDAKEPKPVPEPKPVVSTKEEEESYKKLNALIEQRNWMIQEGSKHTPDRGFEDIQILNDAIKKLEIQLGLKKQIAGISTEQKQSTGQPPAVTAAVEGAKNIVSKSQTSLDEVTKMFEEAGLPKEGVRLHHATTPESFSKIRNEGLVTQPQYLTKDYEGMYTPSTGTPAKLKNVPQDKIPPEKVGNATYFAKTPETAAGYAQRKLKPGEQPVDIGMNFDPKYFSELVDKGTPLDVIRKRVQLLGKVAKGELADYPIFENIPYPKLGSISGPGGKTTPITNPPTILPPQTPTVPPPPITSTQKTTTAVAAVGKPGGGGGKDVLAELTRYPKTTGGISESIRKATEKMQAAGLQWDTVKSSTTEVNGKIKLLIQFIGKAVESAKDTAANLDKASKGAATTASKTTEATKATTKAATEGAPIMLGTTAAAPTTEPPKKGEEGVVLTSDGEINWEETAKKKKKGKKGKAAKEVAPKKKAIAPTVDLLKSPAMQQMIKKQVEEHREIEPEAEQLGLTTQSQIGFEEVPGAGIAPTRKTRFGVAKKKKPKAPLAPTPEAALAEVGAVAAQAQMPMAASIKPVVEDKQLKGFAATLKGVNVQVDKFGNEVVKGTKKASDGTEQAAGKMQKSALDVGQFFSNISHYISFSIGVQAVMAIRTGIQTAIQSFLDLEKAAANAAAVTGVVGPAFQKMKDKIMDTAKVMSGKYLYSAKEIADTFYTLASAGYDVADMGERELLPFLNYAQATQSDLQTATESMIQTLKAFKLEMEDAGHVADVFTIATIKTLETMERLKEGMKYAAPIAGELGASLEETTAAMSTLVDRGEEGGQAGQRLAMIFAKLLKPAVQDREELERLGLTLGDLDPKTHSLVEILKELKAAGADAGTMAELFRSRTAGSAAVLVDNAAAVALFTEQLKNAEGITSAVAESQKETLGGALQLMQQQMTSLAAGMGKDLIPILISITDLLQKLSGVFGPLLSAGVKLLTSNMLLFQASLLSVGAVLAVYLTRMKLLPMLYQMGVKAVGFLRTVHKLLTAEVVKGTVTQVAYKNAVVGCTVTTEGYTAVTEINTATKELNRAMTFKQMIATEGLTKAIIAQTVALLRNPLTAFAVALAAVASVLVVTTLNALNSNKAFEKMGVTLSKSEQGVAQLAQKHKASANMIADIWADMNTQIQGPNLTFEPITDTKKYDEFLQYVADASNNTVGQVKLDFETAWNIPGLEGNDKKLEKLSEVEQKAIERYIRGALTKAAAQETLIKFNTLLSGTEEEMATQLGYTVDEWNKLSDSQKTQIKQVSGMLFEEGAIAESLGYTREQWEKLDETQKQSAKETGNYSFALMKMDDAFNEMTTSEQAYTDALEENDKVVQDSKSTAEQIAAAGKKVATSYETMVRKTETFDKSTRNVIKIVGSMIQSLRAIPGNLDTYIGEMEAASDANMKAEMLSTDLTNARNRENKAVTDLTAALMLYGAGSDEAVAAEEDLQSAVQARMDVEDQINDLQLDGAKSSAIVSAALADQAITTQMLKEGEVMLTETEQAVLRQVDATIKARDSLTKALAKQATAAADLETQQKIQAKGITYLDDKLIKFYEVEDKIFKIESDLYKLRKDENKQLEDMFGTLAEQGLLDKDMIEGYKDMEMAQGDVLKLNKKFMEATSNLSDDQNESVKAFMNATKGTAEYDQALKDLQGAGIDGVSTIIAMKEAQDKAKGSTKDLKEEMSPTVKMLVDMGIVSSETAKQWYDLADNAYELAKGEKDLKKTQGDLGKEFDSTLSMVGQLGASMITGEEGAKDFKDIFPKLTKALGIGTMGMEEMLPLIGYSEEEWGKLSETQQQSGYVLAATMKLLGTDLGMYKDGMDAVTLANQLGLVTSKDLAGGYEYLRNQAVTAIQAISTDLGDGTFALNTYKTALDADKAAADEVAGSLATLTIKVQDLYKAVGLLPPIAVEVDATATEDGMARISTTVDTGTKDANQKAIDNMKDGGQKASMGFWDMFKFIWGSEEMSIQVKIAATAALIVNTFANGLKAMKDGIGGILDGVWNFITGGSKKAADTASANLSSIKPTIPATGSNVGERGINQSAYYQGTTTGTTTKPAYTLPWNCFLAGTKITTPNGKQDIECLKVGDSVISYDLDELCLVKSSVSTVFEHDATNYIIINKRIKVTPEHLIYANGEWKNAGMVYKGDLLLREDGGVEQVIDIERVLEDVKVYNIHTNHITHNYFAEGILVHNRKMAEGGILDKPEMVLAGEGGPEAFIPLFGKNKKKGKDLLKGLIPKYFPDLIEPGVIGRPATGPIGRIGRRDDFKGRHDRGRHRRRRRHGGKDDGDTDVWEPTKRNIIDMLKFIKEFNLKGMLSQYGSPTFLKDIYNELPGGSAGKPAQRFATLAPTFMHELPKMLGLNKPTAGPLISVAEKASGLGSMEDRYRGISATPMSTAQGNVSTSASNVNTTNESFTILGPVNVQGVKDVNDFMSSLKYSSRTTTGK